MNACNTDRRRKGLLISSAFTSALLVAGGAGAQTRPAETAAPPSPPAVQVDEIVVTAEKRSQSLQNVPVAVTVLTAKMAENAGITDVASIQMIVPGLEFPKYLNGTTPTLRGVGTGNGVGASESVVAMYVDDVYVASPAAATFSLNNISQIEVLEGPQGTLYGRNAMAGVIDIRTRSPSEAPSADVTLGYANYDTISGNFYGNTALTSKLFADLALLYDKQHDGWGRNLYNGEPAFRSEDQAARSKLLWRPDAATNVTLTLDYNRSRFNAGTTYSIVPGAVFLNGQTAQGVYNIDENPQGVTNTRQYAGSIRFERDLGFASLIDIVGYRKVKSSNLIDEDQTEADLQTIRYHDDRESLTQEARLVSNLSGPFHWIAGLFYFNDSSDLSPFTLTGEAIAPLKDFQQDYHNHADSYAVFGQSTTDLPEGFHLTLGARYTYDVVKLKADELLDGVLVEANTGSKFHDSAFTYKVNLSKDLTSNIQAYVGYSTGFKGGAYNEAVVQSDPVRPEHLYAAEAGLKSELFDHRLRVNAAYFHYDYKNIQVSMIVDTDGRSSGVLQNAATATNDGFELQFEAHPIAAFTVHGGLEAMHSRFGHFLDATFSVPLATGGNATLSGDASGNKTPFSPDFTANLGGEYTLASPLGDVTVSLINNYNGGFAWAADNRLKQKPYNVLNGSVTLHLEEDAWTVKLWAKNICGAVYAAQVAENIVGDEQVPAPPRTFGLSVGRHF